MVWLREHVLAQERHPERIQEAALQRLRELQVEPPTADRVERMIRSTLRAFEEDFGRRLFNQLSPETRDRFDAILELPEAESVRVPLHDLRADPGQPALTHWKRN
jgi:chromatin segregation and condensation protein Rec8/ScpA/Scc1 (kleisin family)